MTARTIVGWDGGVESEAALDWAVRRAETQGGGVHVVSVMEPFPFPASDAVRGDRRTSQAFTSLDDEVARITVDHPGIGITSELVEGDPTEVLLSYSFADTAIVVGTRRRSGLHFRFAWTFGGRLATFALGPVVIVPSDHSQAGRGIVVGVDGSPESDSAVRFAAAEAAAGNLQLDLVHTWLAPNIAPVPGCTMREAPWLAEAHSRVLSDALDVAREAAPSVRAVGHVACDTAAHALVERGDSAALVVVGARGRGPLSSVVLGSVSTSLIEAMPCPIAILGPQTVDAESESAVLDESAATR